jgi:hypothetical protein
MLAATNHLKSVLSKHFTQHDISCHPRLSAGCDAHVRHEAANLGAILDTLDFHIQLPVSEDRATKVNEQAIHDCASDAMSGGSESNSHRKLMGADCDGKVFDREVKVNVGEHQVQVVKVQRAEEAVGDCVFEKRRNDGKLSFAEAGSGMDVREQVYRHVIADGDAAHLRSPGWR